MRRVVFLGDYNVDLIMDGLAAEPAPDRDVRCRDFELAVGGSSCITACAYARLGGESWFCALSGADYYGDFMKDHLAQSGVRTDHVRIDDRLDTGVTVNIAWEGKRYQITYPGSMNQFSEPDVPDSLIGSSGHLHVSGIYQSRALVSGLDALFARATAAGTTLSLDCQWDDTERWESLFDWLPRLDWFFANRDELQSITGLESVEAGMLQLSAVTPRPVIKDGERGAWVLVDGEPRLVPGFRVEVVDSIGAGDNFDAAFLYAVIENGWADVRAARMANAAAALSCTARGGTAARVSLEAVLGFLESHP
ncbi:carbohydrate kinase family protein [Salinispira pacifica]